jgi:hypothetical protein
MSGGRMTLYKLVGWATDTDDVSLIRPRWCWEMEESARLP